MQARENPAFRDSPIADLALAFERGRSGYARNVFPMGRPSPGI